TVCSAHSSRIDALPPNAHLLSAVHALAAVHGSWRAAATGVGIGKSAGGAADRGVCISGDRRNPAEGTADLSPACRGADRGGSRAALVAAAAERLAARGSAAIARTFRAALLTDDHAVDLVGVLGD